MESGSKYFPCVINSVSPLGGKLSEMFEYRVSDNDDDYKSILYSPFVNVSYFDNDIKNIDIKNLKSIYERKLKKVINNETYNYSNCSSDITYFDDKILCVKDSLDSSSLSDFYNKDFYDSLENRSILDLLAESTLENSDAYFYDCNIISLETGKKLNNTLEDLVDYDEKFIEFLTKEYIEDKNRMRDYLSFLYSGEPEQLNDFYFPDYFDFQNDSDLTEQSDNLSEESLDLPEPPRQSKFIFEFKNDELYLSIYYYWFSTDANYNNSYLPLPIEMKKLKPYIKKDSFYRYLFD